MSTDTPVSLIVFIALLLTSLLLVADASPQTTSNLEDLNWGTTQEKSCRKFILGAIDDLRPEGLGWTIVVIRLLDSDGLESQILIKKSTGQPAKVRSISIADSPIAEQLAAARGVDPLITAQHACQKVKTVARDFESLPGIDDAISELKSITLSPVLEAPFIIHGNHYEIWIISDGALSHFEFMGFKPAESAAVPLQKWIDGVFHLLR